MKNNLKFIMAIAVAIAAQSPVFAQLFKYTLSQTGSTICVQTVPQFTDATACYHGGNAVLMTPTTVSIEAADITNGLGSWSIATNGTFMGINFFQFGSETQSNNQNFVNGTAVTLFCINIDEGECTSGNIRLMLQTNHSTPAVTEPDLSLYNGGVQHTVTASNANNCNPESGTVFDGLMGTTSVSCLLLPVDLVSFNASAQEDRIALTWTSASETNFSGYELQRAENGIDFTKIAWVQGKGGGDYAFQDESVRIGPTYYYRLKMLDLNGGFEHSPIRSAKIEGKATASLSINPNPASQFFVADFETSEDGSATLELITPIGQIAVQQHFQLGKGPNKIMVSTGNQPEGTYLVKLKTVDGSMVEKVAITR